MSKHEECARPSSQGVVTAWGSTTPTPIGPDSFVQGQFSYTTGPNSGRDQRVVVGSRSVEVYPSCAYLPTSVGATSHRLELLNMCPSLRSGGVDCRTAGKCRFDNNTCRVDSSFRFDPNSASTGKCTYDIDLLQDARDVSYLLRSSGGTSSRFPIKAAAALIDDWTRRMKERAAAATPVTRAAQANAWCMATQNRTLGSLQPSENKQDYRTARDPFGDNWGPIYWKQLDWLTALLTRPASDGQGQGELCIVAQNCDAQRWDAFYGAA
jgi:hypothetical protein